MNFIGEVEPVRRTEGVRVARGRLEVQVVHLPGALQRRKGYSGAFQQVIK